MFHLANMGVDGGGWLSVSPGQSGGYIGTSQVFHLANMWGTSGFARCFTWPTLVLRAQGLSILRGQGSSILWGLWGFAGSSGLKLTTRGANGRKWKPGRAWEGGS